MKNRTSGEETEMNVSLTPELERLVEQKVHSGEYKSASEVIRHGLRLVAREDEAYEARLEALRAKLDPAIAEYERGEIIPGPLAVEQARAEIRRLAGRAARGTQPAG